MKSNNYFATLFFLAASYLQAADPAKVKQIADYIEMHGTEKTKEGVRYRERVFRFATNYKEISDFVDVSAIRVRLEDVEYLMIAGKLFNKGEGKTVVYQGSYNALSTSLGWDGTVRNITKSTLTAGKAPEEVTLNHETDKDTKTIFDTMVEEVAHSIDNMLKSN